MLSCRRDQRCFRLLSLNLNASTWQRRNRKDFSEVAMPVRNFAAFQRIAEDKRYWDHFEDFQHSEVHLADEPARSPR
jgi:hypothetical protein